MNHTTHAGEAEKIEEASMELIEKDIHLAFPEKEVAKRIVHATADFSLVEMLAFKGDPVRRGIEAIKSGCSIAVDVKMVAVGINSRALARFWGKVKCFIDGQEVVALAKDAGITRARACMRLFRTELDGNIVAIGNAPTALDELCNLMEDGRRPALVIAAPVGFVGAREAKERVLEYEVPSIVLRGSRGGSPIAVGAVNALIDLAGRL